MDADVPQCESRGRLGLETHQVLQMGSSADDTATHQDEAGLVAEHASRVPSSVRIFVGLPARLKIRPPVPPRPDHGLEPAHELTMLS